MKSSSTFWGKMGHFFKKNVYYIVLFVCIAGIATMITLAAINSNNKDTPLGPPDDGIGPVDPGPVDPDPGPVDGDPIVFIMPVSGITASGMEYTTEELSFVFNVTLRDNRSHKGLDFFAEAGTNVLAVYSGTVTDVYTDIFDGTVVVIKHNDDVTSVYKSLSSAESDIKVKKGDRVAQGDVIGKVSDSMGTEFTEGAHLHFEVLYQGVNANPVDYFETK